jgi:hypothetical protein
MNGIQACYNDDDDVEMETMPLTLPRFGRDSLLVNLDDSANRDCDEESEVCELCNR